jgi:copper chaperone NosL
MMKNIRLLNRVRILLIISGVLLVIALFVPLWQIQLTAPQYPEGLVLKMYPHKLGGSVDIINGLNHYIGMKTLHTKDFIEFTILPFIIVFFSLCCFSVALLKRKKWLIIVTALFVLFGVVAMADFWRWEYNYGHDLNPEAAIQIPGMAYQPPLIGYKQLLNFGAWSVPDIGGYLFIIAGLLLVICIIIQILHEKKKPTGSSVSNVITGVLMVIFVASCNTGPQPIKPGVDACSFCKMTFADNKFGGEMITGKNKIFKFDDMHCLLSFKKSNSVKPGDIKEIYLIRYDGTHEFIQASKAYLLKSDDLRSPMGGNIAAFADLDSLKIISEKFKGNEVTWDELNK